VSKNLDFDIGTHIVWSCPLCGAKGTIDTVNSVELASEMMREAHKLLSPDCQNAKDEPKEPH
jgi:hypothetical protein